MDENKYGIDHEITTSYEEASKYSAASKEYTETMKNISVLENVKLARDKFLAEREEAKEKIRLERIKAEYEHEEKMERLKTERAGHMTELSKGIIGGIFMVAGIVIVLNYEELHPVVSKAMNLVVKPRVF